MFLSCFVLGALAGALLPNQRAVSAIFPVAAVLAFLAVRDHLFDDWMHGLVWFFGNVACFEVGLVLSGIATAYLHQMLESRRLKH